jgi:hypothetical protein
MRRTSEVMKTKSAVKPRNIQRTVLNLEPVELGATCATVAIFLLRKDESGVVA